MSDRKSRQSTGEKFHSIVKARFPSQQQTATRWVFGTSGVYTSAAKGTLSLLWEIV